MSNISSNIGVGGGGGTPKVESWSNRPPSPSDGDRFILDYSGVSGATGAVLLEYDSGASVWLAQTTFGSAFSPDLVKGGSVNTDLFDRNEVNNPTVTTTSGDIQVELSNPGSVQRFDLRLPFKVNGGSDVKIEVEGNGWGSSLTSGEINAVAYSADRMRPVANDDYYVEQATLYSNSNDSVGYKSRFYDSAYVGQNIPTQSLDSSTVYPLYSSSRYPGPSFQNARFEGALEETGSNTIHRVTHTRTQSRLRTVAGCFVRSLSGDVDPSRSFFVKSFEVWV